MSIEIRADVREALSEGTPVVALESTLISHGLPRPENLDVAREAEQRAARRRCRTSDDRRHRRCGQGRAGGAELELLAGAADIPKLSARDLPVAAAKASHGATTVAATAHLAALAGIRLFATGASAACTGGRARVGTYPQICPRPDARGRRLLRGQVHPRRSSDAGVPGDRGRARRRLPHLPLPWLLPYRFGEQAGLVGGGRGGGGACHPGYGALGLGGSGLVVANPLPEEEQLDRDLHDRALISGLEGLEDRGVRGKDVTPFLLDRFATETRGRACG